MKSNTVILPILVWLSLTLAVPPHVRAAQEGRAAAGPVVLVTGQVSNQATGDLLPGAVIQVEGTSIVTVAERGGNYSLSLPAGTYTLLVTFAGLDPVRGGLGRARWAEEANHRVENGKRQGPDAGGEEPAEKATT